jgi:hypothetical protein
VRDRDRHMKRERKRETELIDSIDLGRINQSTNRPISYLINPKEGLVPVFVNCCLSALHPIDLQILSLTPSHCCLCYCGGVVRSSELCALPVVHSVQKFKVQVQSSKFTTGGQTNKFTYLFEFACDDGKSCDHSRQQECSRAH